MSLQQQHHNQALHNKELHDKLCTAFPDQYFDWKITILFYTAIHLLEALAAKKRVNLGESHESRNQRIKPSQLNRGIQPVLQITHTAYYNYKNLYEYSITSRYEVEGVFDLETLEKMRKDDYEHANRCLKEFKLYIENLLQQ